MEMIPFASKLFPFACEPQHDKDTCLYTKKVNFTFFERVSFMPSRGIDPGSLRLWSEAANHSSIVDLLENGLF